MVLFCTVLQITSKLTLPYLFQPVSHRMPHSSAFAGAFGWVTAFGAKHQSHARYWLFENEMAHISVANVLIGMLKIGLREAQCENVAAVLRGPDGVASGGKQENGAIDALYQQL